MAATVAYAKSRGASGRHNTAADERSFATRFGARIRERRRLGLPPIKRARVLRAAGGYSYPELPAAVEAGIPNYYAASRARRGLPVLPADAGLLARSIGRYLAQTNTDVDSRAGVEASIAQVLRLASEEAAQAGDTANADHLAAVATQWQQRVASQAPPLGSLDTSVLLDNPEGTSARRAVLAAAAVAGALGMMQGGKKAKADQWGQALLWAGLAGLGVKLIAGSSGG